jgi:hypothetical protein
MKALKLLAVILSSILIPAPALAGIIGTNGISYISAPTTRNYPKADTLQIFEESNKVAFSESDIALNAGTITPGTLVNSFNIYLHTESNSSTWKTASGSITFDRPILGLIWSGKNLDQSDASFGASGTPYAQIGDWRGLEGNDVSTFSDFFFNGNGNTLNLTFNVSSQGYDELRVLTAATPEPLTILGASTALGFGIFFRKKLAKKKY